MATRDRGLSNDSLSQALGFNFRRGAAAPEAPAARPGGAARERDVMVPVSDGGLAGSAQSRRRSRAEPPIF